jgi:hypothetical protein
MGERDEIEADGKRENQIRLEAKAPESAGANRCDHEGKEVSADVTNTHKLPVSGWL